MKELAPPFFAGYDKDDIAKESQVREYLTHYAQMKQQEPEKFTGFTHEVFYDLVDTYLNLKGDMGLDDVNGRFSHIMQQDYSFKKENADRFAIVADVLVAGMELKSHNDEMIALMRTFDVGAEEHKHHIYAFCEGKTKYA